jgi:hypothetical protein
MVQYLRACARAPVSPVKENRSQTLIELHMNVTRLVRAEALLYQYYGMCGVPLNSVLKFCAVKGHQRHTA